MGNCLSQPDNQRIRFPVHFNRVHPEDTSKSSGLDTSAGHTNDVSVHSSLPEQKEALSIPPPKPSSPISDCPSCPSNSVTLTGKESNHINPTCSNSQHANLKNEAYQAMITYHNQLVTALATDYLNMAGIFLARGFISDEISAKMLLTSSIPKEKATILTIAVRERIKTSPQRFPELVKLFSEHKSTKCIVNLLQPAHQASSESMDEFNHYLKTLYASLTPTQVSADAWPPSATRRVFNLAMIKSTVVCRGQIQDKFVRQTITGKVDDILQEKYPIKLKDIFSETEGKRKVVLLEGAPGCGKSTLSVYISQQWGEDKLFLEFKYVILVRLRDPAVQDATRLADLLPGRNDEMRQKAAKDITACYGKGVLFILDGWDELPSNFRNKSFMYNLINPSSSQRIPLQQSTVIVTSRPIASCDLHPIVSSRIEILGFTQREVTNYFSDCLKGDTKAVATLLERINENPAIASSLYLPMSASILVHLFINDNNTLPTTQYGIFSELVLSCMYRLHNERTQLKSLTLESLEQIPEAIREPFLFLCELAYQGIMDDRVIFSSLPADVKTLGLLQGVESFIRRGKAVSYNFLHLSIQEILAGFYIATQLPDSEQVSKFNELFDKPRFSAVFQFYAAITKLHTPGIKGIVIRVAKEGDKGHFFPLLYCLYEAQDPSLCEFVAEQLQHGLDLSGNTLTLLDCLCIGYFLSGVCKMVTNEFNVDLSSCRIGDQECKYLVSGLYESLDTQSAVTTLFTMNLSGNPVAYCGIHHLSTLLKVGCIKTLQMGNRTSPAPMEASINCEEFQSLQGSFTEQLKDNTTLKGLSLNRYGLSLQSTKSLAEAVATNTHLEELNIGNNALCDDGIQHLACALGDNQGLKVLYVHKCGLTHRCAKSLAAALEANKHLEELNISGNTLGDVGIKHLVRALKVNHGLKILNLAACNLTSQSAKALAEVLNTNKCLEELDICDNILCDDGIEFQCFAHALQHNKCLKSLHEFDSLWNNRCWIEISSQVSTRQ